MTKLSRCLQIGGCLLFCLIGETKLVAWEIKTINEFGPSVPRRVDAPPIAASTAESDGKINLTKKQPLVIKIPRKLLRYENYSLMSGLPIYIADVSVAGEGITVAGESDWQLRGWPPMLTLFYEKTNKKKEYIEIECRSTVAYAKLRFSPDMPNVEAALRQLVFLGSVESFESSAEFKALTEKLLPITFSGVLSQIPRDKQLRLLKDLGYNDDGMGAVEFKGKQYIAFSATDPIAEFNSLQVNQAARVATVLKALVLPAFNKVAPVITDANGIYGIKIKARIFYRDFLSELHQESHAEILEIYAPYDLVEKFFNLDITNQKLVDGSIVLVDGNRIEVDLSKAAQI
jgi:hypothetical protein